MLLTASPCRFIVICCETETTPSCLFLQRRFVASQPVYDVIVIGSGAAGGIASYVLVSRGLNVLCLEAGHMIDPVTDFQPHKLPYEWRYRGKGKPGKYGRLPQGMEWKIKEWTDALYTIPQEDP